MIAMKKSLASLNEDGQEDLTSNWDGAEVECLKSGDCTSKWDPNLWRIKGFRFEMSSSQVSNGFFIGLASADIKSIKIFKIVGIIYAQYLA